MMFGHKNPSSRFFSKQKKKDRAVGKNALQRVQMMIGGIVYFIVMNNDA